MYLFAAVCILLVSQTLPSAQCCSIYSTIFVAVFLMIYKACTRLCMKYSVVGHAYNSTMCILMFCFSFIWYKCFSYSTSLGTHAETFSSSFPVKFSTLFSTLLVAKCFQDWEKKEGGKGSNQTAPLARVEKCKTIKRNKHGAYVHLITQRWSQDESLDGVHGS